MHVLRNGVMALGVVAASWAVGISPALASGPHVPAGCTFDGGTGILTCTSTLIQTVTEGPFTTPDNSATTFGINTPASTLFGDFTGLQICNAFYSVAGWTLVGLYNVTVNGVVTTTTTTEQHGLHGAVFASSSSSTSVITSIPEAEVGCQVGTGV